MGSWTKIYQEFICTTARFVRSIPEMGVSVSFVVRYQVVDMSADERASRVETRALGSGRVGSEEAMQTGESYSRCCFEAGKVNKSCRVE